ncbi:MAG: hypothetical protein U0871_27490 [Gemmataceae bacterium]
MPEILVRCRHCGAIVLVDVERCPMCCGRDPIGTRFALLGSAFYGVLLGGLVAGTYAAVLWHRWERWVKLFGDADDDHARSAATDYAVVGGGLLFAVATSLAAVFVLKFVRFR